MGGQRLRPGVSNCTIRTKIYANRADCSLEGLSIYLIPISPTQLETCARSNVPEVITCIDEHGRTDCTNLDRKAIPLPTTRIMASDHVAWG